MPEREYLLKTIDVEEKQAEIIQSAIIKGDVAKEARRIAVAILKRKGIRPTRLLIIRVMNHPAAIEAATRRVVARKSS